MWASVAWAIISVQSFRGQMERLQSFVIEYTWIRPHGQLALTGRASPTEADRAEKNVVTDRCSQTRVQAQTFRLLTGNRISGGTMSLGSYGEHVTKCCRFRKIITTPARFTITLLFTTSLAHF